MTRSQVYAVSTQLFHGVRLGRDQMIEIAKARFTAIELVATRTHVDYHSDTAVADLQQWLTEARLTLTSVHGPVSESFVSGRHGAPLLLAAADADARAHALAETERALFIARRIPFPVLVVHVGTPRSALDMGRSSRDGARRSLESLQKSAAPLGVKLAIEVTQSELATPGSLVHFLDDVLDVADVGICLDVGHAHLGGDVVEAIETVSEHLLAVDIHDNRGRTDEHLMPFEGTIDWAGALTAIQKVGYDGPLTFELAPRGSTTATLAQASQARLHMDRLFAD